MLKRAVLGVARQARAEFGGFCLRGRISAGRGSEKFVRIREENSTRRRIFSFAWPKKFCPSGNFSGSGGSANAEIMRTGGIAVFCERADSAVAYFASIVV